MNKQQLFENIKKKQSFLCVGLDTDIKKIPQHLLSEEDPIFAFNKAIIDATADYCVAYKPNLAFYESLGTKGMMAFEKTVAYLRENYPDQFIIADAKRGDIGNTCQYKLIGGVLIFIPLRLGIDNHHFTHNVTHTVIGDTMLFCKHGLIKGEFG